MIGELWLDVAWKSGVVAAVALTASVLLRSRAAQDKVAVLRLGLVLITVLPILAWALPDIRLPNCCASVSAAADVQADGTAAPPLRATPVQPAPFASAAEAKASSIVLPSPDRLFAFAYLAGMAIMIGRLALGLATLSRWTRSAEPLAHPAWISALDRASGAGRRPLLKASPHVGSPLSWGWRPAVILLHPDNVARPEQAAAILEHEMAHVRRGDWPLLILSRLVVAALWFNPLVWLLARELARQTEMAADERAVAKVDKASYAQALVTLAGRRAAHASLTMAAPRGELADRVRAVLNARPRRSAPWSRAAAILACLALATPLAALEVTQKMAAPLARAAEPVARLIPTVQEPSATAPSRSTTGSARAGGPTVPPTATAQDGDMARRQRDQGVAMMRAGADHMEDQARRLRTLAETFPPEDRARMIEEAAELEAEARGLRGEATVLASADVSTGMRAKVEKDKPDVFQPESADQEMLRAAGDVRIFDNRDGTFRVEADQMIRTAGADVAGGADTTPASDLDASAEAPDPAGLRRQAEDLRRRAGEIEARADRLEGG